jgi:hypothetical protein
MPEEIAVASLKLLMKKAMERAEEQSGQKKEMEERP